LSWLKRRHTQYNVDLTVFNSYEKEAGKKRLWVFFYQTFS